MDPLSIPTARRVYSLGSALLLTLAMVAAVSAQDDPSPSTEPATSPDAADTDAPLTVGPWHLATIDDAPQGHFVRGVASGESGTIALGNLEFGGEPAPVVWTSDDAMTWERATFAGDARDGLMEAAVATPNGWVAVGRDFPERALAWTSPDGRHWKAARKIESAKGHVLYDVAATPIGLVAVGCEAKFHCKVGKAWVSQDGRSWKVLSQLPIELPKAVAVIDDRIVIAGFSNGFETELSFAVTASSKDGRKWKLDGHDSPRASGYQDLAVRGGEAFTIGYGHLVGRCGASRLTPGGAGSGHGCGAGHARPLRGRGRA